MIRVPWVKPEVTPLNTKKPLKCRWFGHIYVSSNGEDWYCKREGCNKELTLDERFQNWGM